MGVDSGGFAGPFSSEPGARAAVSTIMKTAKLMTWGVTLMLMATTVSAQPPFGRGDNDDDDRRGFRGRGGFRGGPPGDDDGRRGRFRGGPPGFGGPPGRGGFDPSDMLRRLDRNNNGVLDPDEQEGPARFLIGRLQRVDSDIRPGRPVPLDKISEAFERLRGRRGNDNDDRDARRAANEAMEVERLVPGFGTEVEPQGLPGFGPAAKLFSVPVDEEDREEARERMRRYDRDRDGFLDRGEMRRFSGNPLDFDRNRDGRLSESELAVRYAIRRDAEEDSRQRNRGNRGQRDREGPDEGFEDPYGGRNSYRNLAPQSEREGIPGWFTDRDVNRDGQVTMAEYTDRWTDALVAEFFQWDPNRDGVITEIEVTGGVERGVTASSSAQSTADRFADRTRMEDGDRGGERGGGSPAAESSEGGNGTETLDPKLVTYAENIVGRYDANEDGELTASEWKKMFINPAPADADRDGRVSVEEYARYMQKRRDRGGK